MVFAHLLGFSVKFGTGLVGKYRVMEGRIYQILELLKELKWPILYETGGGHEFVSANIFAKLGCYAEEVMHNRDFFPSRIHPEDYPEIDHDIRNWHKQEEPGILIQEFRVKNVEGKYVWLEDYLLEVFPEGKPKFMRGIMILTDAEKRKEIALLERKFQLHRAGISPQQPEYSSVMLQLEEIHRERSIRQKKAMYMMELVTGSEYFFSGIFQDHFKED